MHRSSSSFAALFVLSLIVPLGTPVLAADAEEIKRSVVGSVEEHRAALVELSDRIWELAETALEEHESAELLADYAERQGFEVERGVAGMPTAFTASYGSGDPVIVVMGEYDALPGLSQKAQATKEARVPGAAGHGCGHNLFGPASLGAAIAIKEQIEAGNLSGTVRFYGTPAEEAVGGKLYMIREGLFGDVDVALAWHPDYATEADTDSSQAMVDFEAVFHGQSAHAAFDPWNGRSALDAAELFTHALNLTREHVRPTVRIHYAIKEGGQVPNVVPERAVVWTWIRDSSHESVDLLIERARAMVEGAAMAAGVTGELKIQSGGYEMLSNLEGMRLVHENMLWLGPIEYTKEEQEVARAIQRSAGVEASGMDGTVGPFDPNPGPPTGGSTDVADVSWVVPTLHLEVATAPVDSPWHAWPVVAASRMSIGHKGMTYAAKALAATMVDLFLQPEAREKIRAEFERDTGDERYEGYIPPGPPPLPEAGSAAPSAG